MDEFNGIHIDYTNNKDLNTGLFLTNDSKIGALNYCVGVGVG